MSSTQQVHEIRAGRRAVIHERGAVLPRDGVPRLAQRVCQRIAMDLPRKSNPERIAHGERAADDVPRQLIQPVLICVHPRASACICVKTYLLAVPTTNHCHSVDAPLPIRSGGKPRNAGIQACLPRY